MLAARAFDPIPSKAAKPSPCKKTLTREIPRTKRIVDALTVDQCTFQSVRMTSRNNARVLTVTAPLKLTGTTLRGDSQVRVSYTYETDKGRRCKGRADVETIYLYGRTLISRIKALDGC
ncbi:hypothetical protein AMK05_CH02996 [Rhizobium sp. N324]|nr:hypothetical protein AMK05_CH02996 [Rhizobium sp. N324]OYD04967.1 hypothetical protein AMK08_CH103014 [Rhizobium sp. N4311]